MKRVKVLISGIVQGVAFRDSIKHRAILLNLKGYVKNLDSNKVEAVFEGSDEEIDKIVKYCRKGPILATVENIEIKKDDSKEKFIGFEIIH